MEETHENYELIKVTIGLIVIIFIVYIGFYLAIPAMERIGGL